MCIRDSAKNLGMVFQIRDDLLDYSTEVEIGKPSFQDIKEGKVTYPFFYAFKNANQKEQRKLKTYLGNKKLNKSEVNYLITKLNGIKETEQLASKYHLKAIESANKINNLSVRQEMIELTNIALTRKK